MERVAISAGDLEALSRALRRPLLTPGSPDYEEARRVWNGLIDKRPAVIARCESATEVSAAVRFARYAGLPLAVRGGGHNVAGRAVSDGGLVIDLRPMRRVEVDAARRLVRAGGGATIADVDAAVLPHRLAVPLGLVGETGIGGLTLHGGYGWLSRRLGLTSDNLVAAEVVLGDGRVIQATEGDHGELLWALRGGGGNFGVVTRFEYRAHPIEEQAWLAMVLYSMERAEQVLRGFRTIAASAPDELGLLATLWSAAEEGPLPEEVRGAPVAIVLGCWTGRPGEGERRIQPLRELATPLADLSGPTPFATAQKLFDGDYPEGRLYYWKSLFLPALTDEVIATVAARAWERPSRLSSIDVWGLGGAVGRVAPEATAFSTRRSPFLVALEANWIHPEDSARNMEWARDTYRDVERHGRGEMYLNFPGFVEEGERAVRGAYGRNLQRLRRVKARYDPENVFRGNFNIEPG
jgi:FAD/FMN-containing dehydrogenase